MENQPILSVVVCTYNRDKYLKKCLRHLSRQSASSDLFEILVINNNSTDRTEEICHQFGAAHSELQFKYIKEQSQGLSYCRNRGITESKGDIVSYIDDDAFADSRYAENLISYFSDHPEVQAVGGKVTPVYQNGEPTWMSRYLQSLVAALDLGNRSKPFRGQQFPIGANMAFRRMVFEHANPFNPDLGRKGPYLGSGEEKELFLRLKRKKKKIQYVPEVHVYHTVPAHRVEKSYIKKMAEGIGKSEAIRVRLRPVGALLIRWIQEFFKIGATVILALLYFLSGQWSKAVMLIQFRVWFLTSFIKG